ncbi:retrovirus-related pol polyprotein from transposon TNT 1-94 [Tanacetum coccineum]
MNEDKVKKDLEEIETINIELDHRVSNLIAKNEHLKQTYKQLYDSIKPTRIRSKEQCDVLINQVNQKSMEISDLNAKIQEQGLTVTALKDELKKLKGKDLADNVICKHTIDPEMLKIDVKYLNPRLLNNRSVHSDYLKHTQEEAAILREIVEHGKSQNPLNESLDSACKYTKQIQELLIIVGQTCPSINNSSEKLVVVTPKNKDKRVRFTEPVTSSGNTNTKIASSSNLVSNKPMLSSTGVKPSTSASGHSLQHSKLNANSEPLCVKCNGCMLSDNHDLCVLDFINDVNARTKSRSVKKSSKRKFRNACPLTRITTTAEVPLRKPTALESDTPKPVVTLVYSRKPKKSKTNVPVSKPKNIKSLSANKKEPSKSWGSIVSDVPSSSLDECRSSKLFSGTVKFRNDHVEKILGYGDYQIRNFTISMFYYVEGLGHNLFSTGSRGNNLYTLSLGDMMVSSPICLLLKALKTKSWLWHRHLSQLNFGAINHLSRHGLVLGLPKLKFEKDHLTDNGTEFVNQTLREYYEKVGISHETSVARSPQQNGVVERRNRTLIEAARTMLIYAKAPLFLWAEAVATACYTQNCSIIRLRHGKTPYELLHDKLPDLSFFHVFGALCYPTNDSENLGKLQPKADIDFDELTAMASEHSSSGPALHEMTPATISSGLVPNPPPSTPVDHPAPEVIALIAEVVAPEPAASTGSPSSTTVDQDAPSPSNSQTTLETQSCKSSGEMLQIYPKLPGQKFEDPPFKEEILSFIRDLGHTGEIKFYLMSMLITCVNHGDQLLPSSISV